MGNDLWIPLSEMFEVHSIRSEPLNFNLAKVINCFFDSLQGKKVMIQDALSLMYLTEQDKVMIQNALSFMYLIVSFYVSNCISLTDNIVFRPASGDMDIVALVSLQIASK